MAVTQGSWLHPHEGAGNDGQHAQRHTIRNPGGVEDRKPKGKTDSSLKNPRGKEETEVGVAAARWSQRKQGLVPILGEQMELGRGRRAPPTLLCATSSLGTDWALLSSLSLSLFFLRLRPRLKRRTWRRQEALLQTGGVCNASRRLFPQGLVHADLT